MLSTTAAYLAVSSNLSRAQATVAASPTVQRQTAYYLANIGKVTSISDFVNNYKLFSYAMNAYGLGDMTYAKGLMTKVLEGGVSDSSSLANTMNDPRFKAFATAFNFAGLGNEATSTAAATTGTTSAFVEQTLETQQGAQNTGVELALYFKRNAATVTSTYGLLANASLLKVVQTAFGISPYSSAGNVDIQAANLKNYIDVKDLQDPKKVNALVERFTAMWDAGGNNTSSSASSPVNALLASSSSGSGLSSDLLMSIANLKLGG